MNPLLPLNTRDVLPTKPAEPKPPARRDFEAHVRPHVQEQGQHGSTALPSAQARAQPHGDDAVVPLDACLAMVGMAGRLYPQGLHATGYLSMLSSAGVEAETLAAYQLAPEGSAASAGGAAPAPQASMSMLSTTANTDVATMYASGNTPGIEEKTGAIDDATDLRTTSSGDFAEWARRMVRFSDGTATLWIRDYRLDASQRQALVDQLHPFARDTGKPLQRVMLNGEEIWRAGAGNQDIGKGKPHGR